MARKAAVIVAAVVWGTILGRVSSFVVWEMIYGIGDLVIEDQEYFDLAPSVHAVGTIVGTIIGLISGVFTRRPLIGLLAIHVFSGICFFVYNLLLVCSQTFQVDSWRGCLVIYGILLAIVMTLFTWIFPIPEAPSQRANNDSVPH